MKATRKWTPEPSPVLAKRLAAYQRKNRSTEFRALRFLGFSLAPSFLSALAVGCLSILASGCGVVSQIGNETRNTGYALGHQAQVLKETIEQFAEDERLAWEDAVVGLEQKTYQDMIDLLDKIERGEEKAVGDANEILDNVAIVLGNIPGAERLPVVRDVLPRYIVAERSWSQPDEARHQVIIFGSNLATGAPELHFGPEGRCDLDDARANLLVFSCPVDLFRVRESFEVPVGLVGRLRLYERRPLWSRIVGGGPPSRHERNLTIRLIPDVLGWIHVSTTVETSRKRRNIRSAPFNLEHADGGDSDIKRESPILVQRGFSILQDSIVLEYRGVTYPDNAKPGTRPYCTADNRSAASFTVRCDFYRYTGWGFGQKNRAAWANGTVSWIEEAEETVRTSWSSLEDGQNIEVRWGEPIDLSIPGCPGARQSCLAAKEVRVRGKRIDGKKIALQPGRTEDDWLDVKFDQAAAGIVTLMPKGIDAALEKSRLVYTRVDTLDPSFRTEARSVGGGRMTKVTGEARMAGAGDSGESASRIVVRTNELFEEARNPETPAERLEALAEHSDSDVRYGVARNSIVSVSILERLSEDEYEWVRMGVASNWEATPRRLLRRLGGDRSALVRAEVAMNPNVPGDLFRTLAEDAAAEVREGVSRNHSPPVELLRDSMEND